MTAEDTAKEVLSKIGVWWPAADEGQVRAAGDAWHGMADAIDQAAKLGTEAAAAVGHVYRGAAADAFTSFWGRYNGSCAGHLPAAAQACRDVANACTQYADAIAGAKHKLEELAVEIGATVVVGTALAIFTFGASEVAAGAVSAGLITAAGLAEGTVAAVIADIAATAFTFAAIGGLEAAAIDVAVAQPIRVEGFHDGGYSAHEIETAALGGAVGGGLLAGAGRTFSTVRALRGATSLREVGPFGEPLPGGGPVHYDPVTRPGPLADPNVPYVGRQAGTFRSNTYTGEVLDHPVTVHRWSGGEAGAGGSFWTRGVPTGPGQAELGSAINPGWGNDYSVVETRVLPAGTTIYRGPAGPQAVTDAGIVDAAGKQIPLGHLLGGDEQIFLPRLPPEWGFPSHG